MGRDFVRVIVVFILSSFFGFVASATEPNEALYDSIYDELSSKAGNTPKLNVGLESSKIAGEMAAAANKDEMYDRLFSELSKRADKLGLTSEKEVGRSVFRILSRAEGKVTADPVTKGAKVPEVKIVTPEPEKDPAANKKSVSVEEKAPSKITEGTNASGKEVTPKPAGETKSENPSS